MTCSVRCHTVAISIILTNSVALCNVSFAECCEENDRHRQLCDLLPPLRLLLLLSLHYRRYCSDCADCLNPKLLAVLLLGMGWPAWTSWLASAIEKAGMRFTAGLRTYRAVRRRRREINSHLCHGFFWNQNEEELAGGRVGSAHPSAGPKHILAKCLVSSCHQCAYPASIHPS